MRNEMCKREQSKKLAKASSSLHLIVKRTQSTVIFIKQHL